MPNPAIRRHRTYAQGGAVPLTAAQLYQAKVTSLYSPLVYYPMHEASGTDCADVGSYASGGTYSAEDIAGATLAPDGVTPAPLFVGADDDFMNPDSDNWNSGVLDMTNKSLSLWYRFDGNWATSSANFLRLYVDSDNDIRVLISAANNLRLQWRANGSNYRVQVDLVAEGLNNGNWHHLLMTFDQGTSGNHSAWIDGASVGTVGSIAAWSATAIGETNTVFGAQEDSAANPTMEGALCDIAIIGSVLDGDDATILAIYSGEIS